MDNKHATISAIIHRKDYLTKFSEQHDLDMKTLNLNSGAAK